MYFSKKPIRFFVVFLSILGLFFLGSCSPNQNDTTSSTQTKTSKLWETAESTSSYEYTSPDGTVFSTTLGSADVRINNTQMQSVPAKFLANKAGGETVRIEDYYNGCDLSVASPLNYYTVNETYSRDILNNISTGSFSIHASQGPVNIIGFIEEDYIVDGSITVLQYDKSGVCQFFVTAQYYEDVGKTNLVQLEAFVAVSFQESSSTGTVPSTQPSFGSSSSGSQYSLPMSSQCTMCYGSKICPTCHGQKHSYVTGYGITSGEYVDCQGCHGTGTCWHCGGTGIEPGY